MHVEDVHHECVFKKKYIEQIDDLYEDFNVVKLPLLDDEVRGATNINSFSQHLLKQYKP
jgi:arsenite-transporting ATPase